MGRPCGLCQHARRPEIDAALVGGQPYRNISKRFQISPAALSRHRAHVSRALRRADMKRDSLTVSECQARIETLYRRSEQIMDKAATKDDLRVELAGLQQARETLKAAWELLVAADLEARVLALEASAKEQGDQ